MSNRLLLVDLSGAFHRNFHAMAGETMDAIADKTLSGVRWLARDYEHVAICCDSGRSFRHDLAKQIREWDPEHKGYKGKRPPSDPVLQAQMARVERELYAEGFPIFRADRLEADDVIATLCAWARANGYAVDVSTEDKDLRSLATDEPPAVRIVRKSGEINGPEEVLARFGVLPHRLIELLAIAGDASDGVPGVAGLGLDKAAKLLNGFESFPKAHALAVDEAADVLAEEALRKSQKANGQKMDKPLPRKFQPASRAAIAGGLRAYEVSLSLVTLRTDAPIDCARAVAPRVVPEDVTHEAAQDALLLKAQAQAEEDEQAEIEAAIEAAREEDQMTTANTEIKDAEFTTDAVPSSDEARRDADRASMAGTMAEAARVMVDAPRAAVAAAQPVATPANANATTAQPEPAKPAAPHAALAKVALPSALAFEKQLEARNLTEVDWIAAALATGKKFKDCPDKASVITKLVIGRSLGMNLFQSMRLYIVEGQVTMRTAQVLARVKTSPLCEYIRKKQGNDQTCTWVTKRKGEPEQEYTFTIERAKRAGLGGTDGHGGFNPASVWFKWPEDMLSARAVMPLMRQEYPEIADGYAAEEFDVDVSGDREAA